VYIVTVDQGTSSTKTALWDAGGDLVAEATASYDLERPEPLWAQIDAERWWDACCSTVRAVLAQGGVRPGDVAAVALDGIPARLAGASFGWRQPAAAAITVLLLLAPIGALGMLVLGVDGPLARGSRDVLPAYVGAEMRTTDRPRSLVLSRGADDRLIYDLLSAPQPQLGDVDVAGPASTSAVITSLVSRLAAGLGADEVEALATHGIRYVVLGDARAAGDPLVESLDSQPGLRRVSARDGAAVWQLVPTSSRAQVIDPPEAVAAGTVAMRVARAVPTVPDDPRTPPSVATTVAAGVDGRTLVLSEAIDSRWTWTVDGSAVTSTSPTVAGGDPATDPSIQQVGLVSSSVPVTISFDGSSRSTWLWAQGAVLLLVALLALPSRRVEDDDDSDAFEDAPDAADVAVGPDQGGTSA